ncbi:unnamed protein product [Adineta ricciae]|uniref:Uncharacterized protein n=1 Tax=Adineta ricciae TaxID=249248 RepID=A0A814QYK2_ADIRI|nr:unnamed protein product [Adineta ricciae]
MQAFVNFRQKINDLSNANPSTIDSTMILKQLEEEPRRVRSMERWFWEALNLCLSCDNEVRSLHEKLLSKSDELLELTQQRFDLAHQLNTMKESAGAVISCLNISLKSSCHVIARTIIEMITHGQFQAICTNIELLMERFRPEKHYPKAFINIYQTLSESVHNCNLRYKDDVLPISDINGNTFRKANAIALAKFYCIVLPNMKYEIIASLVDLPANSSYWFTGVQNSLNLTMATTTTTTENDDKSLKKRKLETEDQENDIQ